MITAMTPIVARRGMRLLAYFLAVLSAGTLALFIPRTLAPRVTVGRQWPAGERVSLAEIDHRAWDELLRRHVDESGMVGYAGWKESTADITALDDYLALLSRGDPNRTASREARLAFWMNAYNAVTIRGILREYPTASIQDHAHWLWGYNIWRDLVLVVGGRSYSLGEIEHQILRPLREPRIHFAIVCASRGCPRLLNRAYIPSELEAQLAENSRNFFADPQKAHYDAATHRLQLSPILEWYAGDFGKTPSEVVAAILPYFPNEIVRALSDNGDVPIDYLEYDWSLNDQNDSSAPPPAPEAAACQSSRSWNSCFREDPRWT